jgi:HlyD family secretion protein
MTNADQNTDLQRIEIRSEEVQEILGITPSWIIRWGITLMVIVLVGLIIGSWFFKYPDVIGSAIIITTENPPAAIVAKATGKIEELFVADNQRVQPGDHLAIIENPARYESIRILENKLTQLIPFFENYDTTQSVQFPGNLVLGEIQFDFTDFYKNYRNLHDFLELAYHSRKIGSVREEIDKYRVYYNRIYRQRNLLSRELELARLQFSRDSILFVGEFISMADLEQSESMKIKKEHDFEQAKIHLSETTIKISELEKEILDLQLLEKDEKKKLENQLLESYNNLVSALDTWEQIYLLKASQEGITSFTKFWSEDQNVTVGDIVLSIVPENAGKIVGRINLKQKRAGKVKPGLDVNIKLDNYPYMEFGMVKGVIESISLVPNNTEFTAEVDLPYGLITNYGEELEFNQEMIGRAEIITDSRPLLIRIIEPFRYIYEKNFRN